MILENLKWTKLVFIYSSNIFSLRFTGICLMWNLCAKL